MDSGLSRQRGRPLAGPAGSSPGMTGSEFHKLFSFFQKFCLTAIWTRIIVIWSRPTRGAFRDRHKRGAGRGGHIDERACLRTEKTCGPDTPTLVSSLREGARATVANKPAAHRGEHAIIRKPLRGECRVIPVYPTNACAFYSTIAHAAIGRIGRPAFPAPSIRRGRE